VSDWDLEAERDEQGEREGDLEDDAIGEWTGSEDLRTGVETTEDEVCKCFLPRCFHASSHFWADNLSDHNRPFILLPSSSLCFVSTFASRRALASGQTYLTKNALVENANNAAPCVVSTFNGSENRARSPAAFPTFLIPLSTHFL